VVLQAFPERSKPSLNLQKVRSATLYPQPTNTYHELPHNALAEMLGSGIDAQRHHVSSIDAFFLYAALSFLFSDGPLLLELAGLALGLGLFPGLGSRRIHVPASGKAEDGQIMSTCPTTGTGSLV
jgi:hypothetical protein